MFAISGFLLTVSGFYAFLVFRFGISFVMILLVGGITLFGVQVVNNIRIYRSNRQPDIEPNGGAQRRIVSPDFKGVNHTAEMALHRV